MCTPRDLTTFIPTVNYWRRGWGLDLIAYVYNDIQGSHDEIEVTFDQLEQHHRALPGLLDASIDWHARHGYTNYADGLDLSHNVDLLEGRILSLTDTMGVKMSIAGLRDIPTRDLDDDNVVVIKAYNIETERFTSSEDVVYTLVVNSLPITSKFSVAELESKYPGWEARSLVGGQLGLDGRALLSYVFYDKPGVQSSVQLSTINFG